MAAGSCGEWSKSGQGEATCLLCLSLRGRITLQGPNVAPLGPVCVRYHTWAWALRGTNARGPLAVGYHVCFTHFSSSPFSVCSPSPRECRCGRTLHRGLPLWAPQSGPGGTGTAPGTFLFICVSQNIYRKMQAKRKKTHILPSTFYVLGLVSSSLHAHVNEYT